MPDPADLIAWLLAGNRALGLFLLMPFLGQKGVPVMVRIFLAMAVAVMAAPFLGEVAIPNTAGALVAMMAKELAVGLSMGLAVQLIFITLGFASHLITVEVGMMPSPEFNPSAGAGGGPLSTLLFYLGVLVLMSGAHYSVLLAFIQSFTLLPPGVGESNPEALTAIVGHSASIFRIGVLMAAPLVAVNFLVNLLFAFLGRVVPRMNVFLLSLPARILAGFTFLALSVGLISQYLVLMVNRTPELTLRFMILRGN
ncbi:MAG: type III secretion protein [Puniceicoccaceae bacterium]|nr:MAG: type III secretion protein [Puniceicoccaceae bacterium]